MSIRNTNYIKGEDYLKLGFLNTIDIEEALCPFERLSYKILLSQKVSLSHDEIIVYVQLCLLDNDKSIPYSLAVDLNKLRKQNDAFANYLLGIIYGRGIKPYEKNDRLAFECYKKSYESGFEKSKLVLAKCYFKGIGTEIDFDKAKPLLLCCQHNKIAKTYLGYILYRQKQKNGLKLLNEANAEEEIESFYYLGVINEEKDNFDKALLFYRTGSDLGEQRCHYKAGSLLYKSDNQYYKKIAKTYLEKATKCPEALELLGDIAKEEGEDYQYYYHKSYLLGGDSMKYAMTMLENETTEAEGIKILKTIAKKHDNVDLLLFRIYAKQKRKKTALYYLRRAIAYGNSEAIKIAENFYPNLIKKHE